jgi:hypothetical protein
VELKKKIPAGNIYKSKNPEWKKIEFPKEYCG